MIDHIVYVTDRLENGIEYIKEQLGTEPIYGGRHLKQGTHNAIVAIGESQYLEILAPDPDNHEFTSDRWMGIDCAGQPVITRWAVKSKNIPEDILYLSKLHPKYSDFKEGQRITASGDLLRWELSMPLPKPRIDVVPFLIDWKDSAHPASILPLHCSVISLELFSPRAKELSQLLAHLPVEVAVFPSVKEAFRLTLQSPKGIVTIS